MKSIISSSQATGTCIHVLLHVLMTSAPEEAGTWVAKLLQHLLKIDSTF